MTDEREACPRCGVLLETGDDHVSGDKCIKALRKAMLAQRAAAQRLGTDIALQFLRALEELSLDPDCGFHYAVWDGEEKKPYYLERHQVAGVFAAILHKYKALVDFSPLRDAEQRAAELLDFAKSALTFLDVLKTVTVIEDNKPLLEEIDTLLEQLTLLSVRLPDLPRS